MLSVPAETTFRTLAGESVEPAEKPWVPIGNLGPLLLLGHYNPAATGQWRIPDPYVIRVLIEQEAYELVHEDLAARLQARPLRSRVPWTTKKPADGEMTPETALK